MKIDHGAGPASAGQARISGVANPIEIWGGVECTVARIGEDYRDLLTETGHRDRPQDLDALAALGIRTLRYPVLWEHVAPDHPSRADWSWHDDRLARLARLGVRPIAGLLHHGSGPRYTNLLDSEFPDLLARYAEQVARRYPRLELYTPVNEPLTTAPVQLSLRSMVPAHEGFWQLFASVVPPVLRHGARNARYPPGKPKSPSCADRGHRQDIQHTPAARSGRVPKPASLARLRPAMRAGDAGPRLVSRVPGERLPELTLRDLADRPCPPDIVGINYYLSSDRFLDQRRSRYPRASWGGNGTHCYADVEAVRIARADLDVSVAARLGEAWYRYGLPIAVTEVHNGCTREEQLRWLRDVYAGVLQVKRGGADIRALTLWAALGSIDWNVMLTHRAGHYETGLLDVRLGNLVRPTALARAAAALLRNGQIDHAVVQGRGWWERDMRYYRKAREAARQPADNSEPIVITGATGTLGRAFARICDLRGLPYRLTSRAELEIADPASIDGALVRERPWAIVNTAGYVRVADAEREPERCFRENTEGAANLAAGLHEPAFRS